MAAARDALAAARLIALMLSVAGLLWLLAGGQRPAAEGLTAASVTAVGNTDDDRFQAGHPAHPHPADGLQANARAEAEPESSRHGKAAVSAPALALPAARFACTTPLPLQARLTYLRAPRSHLSQAPPAQA